MKKGNLINTFLKVVEKGGNALPHPATLFGIFALIILALSAVFGSLGISADHPITGETFEAVNLLNKEGLYDILTLMVKNFTAFAPLGIVIVAMLGIGIAENSGLIAVMIRGLVLNSPQQILTFIIVLAGIVSNLASSVGYVLLVPLAGTIFLAIGRHPIAGMAAAFAGVSGGFSANLVLGTIDPLLAGLSEEAAHLVDKTYHVNPTANYYFMVVSTFLIAGLGTFVTEKIVVPSLGEYDSSTVKKEKIERLSPEEKKGLRRATYVFIAFIVLLGAGMIPENGILRGLDGSILKSPVLKGVVAILFLVAGIMGVVYGFSVKKYKSDADVMKGMAESMKSLAAYLVLVFFAAQFVAYFNWSNLGIILAIDGAALIKSLNLSLIPLIILFVIFSGTINLIMGSASAKWALLAPIFVPMFMFLGYSPELTQVVYRIGDSVTNIISPMMSFFALIIVYFEKYDKKAGIGTLVATMLPYSIMFFIGWVVLLIVWLYFKIPLGPGAGIYY
ncbi:AbgT family transporter [Candidatus Venteria ishoeyi]|uniref:p-aminobenzoyl-glutamate transport protein n=1 Tax=Candidatus Venteria ishoeyi TaxID=1899563 RepID=A0A1H6F8A8_9GAMM|nr:AbgT family transporter [Candidatus Venteria ishoeyi]SEH05286.1 p-aminobenzoyl-glutamate transport protein [Candidatus Venteria ishoeyi]